MNLPPVSYTSLSLSGMDKTNHSYDGILDPSPHAKCLAVRHGSYSASGLEGKYTCALRSPHRYTTNELPSCVAYGLRSWVRANARAKRPSGPAWMSPRRVRVGAGGGGAPPEEAVVPGGLAVLLLVFGFGFVFFGLGSGFDGLCRCWRIRGRDRGESWWTWFMRSEQEAHFWLYLYLYLYLYLFQQGRGSINHVFIRKYGQPIPVSLWQDRTADI